ncbi:uncharacterized protein LOC127363141 [Xyrichtys novacula]|uniref:Glycosyltransferase family 92 protein n=1 Tax=Xyrichtys novacula TaxID=13765 RepID=A0AAV1FXG7_XYRNO|nr:uncharacterized protein LOC127363141 [Xyrichtys novacula]
MSASPAPPSENPSELVNFYNHTLSSCLDQLAPIRTKYITFKHSAPWYTSELRRMKAHGCQLEQLCKKTNLNVHRQAYAHHLHRYNDAIKSSSFNPKVLFSTVNKLLKPYVSLEQRFLRVKGTKTLLVSAYQEHRTGKKGVSKESWVPSPTDLTHWAHFLLLCYQVRVNAVALRSQRASYVCSLCCHGKLYITEGLQRIHQDHFGFAYGMAHILCDLPLHCKTASYIAVTSAAASAENNVTEFFEVRNQEAKSGSFPYNFTTCFSTMFNFNNLLQLVQSLEMLQLLGVDRVVIYKTSYSPEVKHLLNYYIQKGYVEVIDWPMIRYLNVSQSWRPDLSPGDIHYYGQIAALNDCVYRYMYKSKYVALHDPDELILPQSVNSWLELLPLLEKRYGKDKCYKFENNVFHNNIMLPPPSFQTLPPESRWQKVSGVNILAHLYREPVNGSNVALTNFKIIVNPRVVFEATVHGLLSPGGICYMVDRKVARMYHTRQPMQKGLKPEQLIYDGRLLNYSPQLTSAVNTVLTESGLLPQDSVV